VLEGTVTFLAGNEWMDAAKGTFLRIPAGVTHDFENRSDESAGLLNIYIPGGFEKDMPAIVEWFKERAAKG
jgi:mannose-6-phosphate isomerase-like protein (cupin superfamily)